jgi:hypothetical protein
MLEREAEARNEAPGAWARTTPPDAGAVGGDGVLAAEVAEWMARGPWTPWGCLMFRHDVCVPELIPQLSRGSHRSPRKGACFMELASYLAGERWSDQPACTHPLLASLARLVNDHTTDAGRGRLVGLVPSVIGLTSDDLHVDVEIALRSATTALPVVSAERQRVLAVGVLAAERVWADLDGLPADRLQEQSRWVLAQVPHAVRWAQRFTQEIATAPKDFRRRGAPNIVRSAVLGIAQACVPDPDAMLRGLLAGAIADGAAWVHRDPDPVATTRGPTPTVQGDAAPTAPDWCHAG